MFLGFRLLTELQLKNMEIVAYDTERIVRFVDNFSESLLFFLTIQIKTLICFHHLFFGL